MENSTETDLASQIQNAGKAMCSVCNIEVGSDQNACPSCGQPVYHVDPYVGKVIADKYRVIAKIAVGGMSVIYKAEQILIKREVALKILELGATKDQLAVERFKSEAEKASSINHPNAVTIYDFGELKDGVLYLAMEYVAGQNLREVIQEDGFVPEARTIHIMKQVCEVLSQAHRRGIIHRDLKPDNIMIEPERSGRKDWVVVLDFGIAKTFGEGYQRLTMTGNILGTPHYMSPEQCEGKELDARSDIYSLGIVMFEMLTGKVPFDTNSASLLPILMMHVKERPKPLRVMKSDLVVSPLLEKIVMKALSKEKHWRQQDASEMLRELKLATESNVEIPPDSTPRIPRVHLPIPTVTSKREEKKELLTMPPPPTMEETYEQPETGVSLFSKLSLGAIILLLIMFLTEGVIVEREEKGSFTGRESAGEGETNKIYKSPLDEGQLLYAKGNYLEAIDAYNRALRLNQADIDAYFGLAKASEKAGLYEQSEGFYRKFVDLVKESKDESKKPQELMATKRLVALRDMKNALKMAKDLFESGDYPGAITAYKLHLSHNPEGVEGYLGLGMCYLEQRRFGDAEEQFIKAVELDQANPEAHFQLGKVFLSEGKFKEAEASFKKSLELNPANEDLDKYLKAARAKAREAPRQH